MNLEERSEEKKIINFLVKSFEGQYSEKSVNTVRMAIHSKKSYLEP